MTYSTKVGLTYVENFDAERFFSNNIVVVRIKIFREVVTEKSTLPTSDLRRNLWNAYQNEKFHGDLTFKVEDKETRQVKDVKVKIFKKYV